MINYTDVKSPIDSAAIKLAQEKGAPESWLPYLYEVHIGGMLITGCATRPKKSGPYKGEPMYLTKEHSMTVIVTRSMMEAAKA